MIKKDFSNSLAETISMLADPGQDQPEEKPKKKQEDYVKVLLRMKKTDRAALQQIARTKAAAENRNYSLTELINDVLEAYLKKSQE